MDIEEKRKEGREEKGSEGKGREGRENFFLLKTRFGCHSKLSCDNLYKYGLNVQVFILLFLFFPLSIDICLLCHKF